jgi:hypothetical protein
VREMRCSVGSCVRCGGWGRPGGDGVCRACAAWLPRGRTTNRCRRCRHHTRLNTDKLCRTCLIEIRHGDVEWAIAELRRQTLAPRPGQLALLLGGIRFGNIAPLRRHDQPIARPDRLPVWVEARVPPAQPTDDQRICRPELAGQMALLTPPRSFTVYDANKIRDRVLPGFEQVVPVIRRLTAERGHDVGTGRNIIAMARLALAAREPDEYLVREEDLDQLPTHRRPVTEALRLAGLLRPRAGPAPRRLVRRPRHARTERLAVLETPDRSCGHCLAWAGDDKPRCRACTEWERTHPAGDCRRCQRELALTEGLCRFCTLALLEHPFARHSIDQQWFGLPGVAPVVITSGGPGRFGKSGRIKVAKRQAAAARGETRKLSDHLVDPHQLALFDTPPRDWRPVLGMELPALTEQAQQLLDELDQIARRGLWTTRHAYLRTLRIVSAWLGVQAPIHELDLAAIAHCHDGNHPGRRVAQFLQTKGLLIPDPAKTTDVDQAGVERLVAALPANMMPDVQAWITAMRGAGRRPSPPKSWPVIRRYLRTLEPILHGWASQVPSLAAISPDDIRDVLKAKNHPHRHLGAMRSLFRTLRRERRIFHDPCRRMRLASPQRLPRPLSSDRLNGLIDRVDGTSAKLVIALLAIHALRPKEIRHITLDDLDRPAGRLTVRRRNGYVHKVVLDELTLALIATWLRDRADRWPTSTNHYLLVSQVTAYDTRNPPVTKLFLRNILIPLGVTATQLSADRLLDEARHTKDPVHLMRVFGISTATAVKYLHAACPEEFVTDLARP